MKQPIRYPNTIRVIKKSTGEEVATATDPVVKRKSKRTVKVASKAEAVERIWGG